MSYQNRNNVTNRVGGTGIGSKAGQSIYDESSTPKFALGEKLEFADGRVFRYGYTGAAVKAGLLVAPDESTTSVAATDNAVSSASGEFSPAAGSTKFQVTLASKSENQFAGAYFQVGPTALDAGVGEGIQYRIKSNSATAATTAGKVDIELYDPIKVALTTASDFYICGNPHDELIAANSADTVVVGVAPIAFTANYYGWFQTAGIALVYVESNGSALPAIGDNVTLGDGTAGACQLSLGMTSQVDPIIGIAANVGVAGEFIGVRLRLGEV